MTANDIYALIKYSQRKNKPLSKGFVETLCDFIGLTYTYNKIETNPHEYPNHNRLNFEIDENDFIVKATLG